MKTVIVLIVFELLAFFAWIFYFQENKPEIPPYKPDVEHIERINDSISEKLVIDSVRFNKALTRSQKMLKEVEILTKQK